MIKNHTGNARRFVSAAILGTLALGFAATAPADDNLRKVTVKFADLNVSTPEGAAVLYSRIRAAAKTVCEVDDFSPFTSRSASACVRESITQAVTKVNQTALYTVFNEHYKASLPANLLSTR